MRVTIVPHSYLKAPLGKDKIEVEVDLGGTVRDALDKLDVPEDLVVAIVIDEITSALDTPLKEGDVVHLLPLISGGY